MEVQERSHFNAPWIDCALPLVDFDWKPKHEGEEVICSLSPSVQVTACEGIEVKVEPTLNRVDSIEGGPKRITRKENLRQRIQQVGEYLKAHTQEEWYGFKIALAMVLSSIPVLVGPLYDYFGVNSVWLTISVIIIYEPAVGSLLSKGLQRLAGTTLAIVLSLICAQLAEASGRGEVYVIPVLLFLGSFVLGFLRQVWPLKKKYDYTALITIITFGLLTLSEYRIHAGPRLAGLRMLLIVMGFVVAVGTNLAIKPKFAGKDLHQMVSDHFSKIAVSLDACVQTYLAGTRAVELQKLLDGSEPEDEVHEGYRTVILAKGDEDLLHDLVIWEPPHGQFGFKYPWDLYKDISRVCRHCMYSIVAMDACLRSEIQCPVHLRELLARPMTRLAEEAVKALKVMGESVSEMKVVNLRPFLSAVEAAALDLQKELQEKTMSLIIPTSETDRWIESYLDEDDERSRASMSSSKARRSAVTESAEGKRASTEDDESVEFSFPIMHVEEGLDDVHPHTDSYGHQSRVTPERSLLRSTPSDLQERHRPSVELTYLEPIPPSRQGSLVDRISRRSSSRQIMVPVPGGIAVLSLVQFVCTLVEFAAKLNLLVNCVNNLSEKAGFTDDGKIRSRRESTDRQTHLETVTTDSR
ncbi:hypothetical protein M758_UG078400 [Ceratodon purpureus]|nr:hypothetical protein M758_UG078400 [Ceratodon purpureus]